MFLFARELEWYADYNERVIGILLRDVTDGDYGGVVLGRDERGRFRAVALPQFSDSRETATQLLRVKLQEWSQKPNSEFMQGDHKGTPIEVFVPRRSGNLSTSFALLSTKEAFSPARKLIESLMPYYEDVDGNFVEQFQTTAFDARFWELYLFALLNEQGYFFDRSFRAPDFMCEDLRDRIFFEAVTVNPTTSDGGIIIEPEIPTDLGQFKKYYQEYMAIKWGSVLTSKLKKKYWDLPHVQGYPIVFAVQDFHMPRAMTFLSHSITSYLYGVEFTSLYDAKANLTVKTYRRARHTWGDKSIESGFFDLPNSENISAVLTNPTATLSKFNRMAHLAGFGTKSVSMFCVGFCHDHDQHAVNARQFRVAVNDPRYREDWVQGANVFHNPKAKFPLDESVLVGAAHHWFDGQKIRSLIPEFHPYGSQTLILAPKRV
jgi:hypothetical protein